MKQKTETGFSTDNMKDAFEKIGFKVIINNDAKNTPPNSRKNKRITIF